MEINDYQYFTVNNFCVIILSGDNMLKSMLINSLKIKKGKINQFKKAKYSPRVMSQLIQMVERGALEPYYVTIFTKRVAQIFLFYELDDKSLADGKNVCYFSNLFVHPKLRNNGLGTRCIQKVMDAARAKGFSKMILGVYAENEYAIRIYEKLGFTQRMGTRSCDAVCKDENGNYLPQKEYLLIACDL